MVVMKHLLLKWGGISAAVGILIATGFFVALQLTNPNYPFPYRAMQFLWPSSIALLGTEGIERSLQAHVIILIAILLNGLAYSLVSTIISVTVLTWRRWSGAR
jgi:hypothetical protein